MAATGDRPRKIELTIAWSTLGRILVVVLLAWLAVKLWPLLQLLFLALLVAITLWPVLELTRKRGWPRWIGVGLCSLLLFSLAALFVGVLVPAITSQGGALIEKLPTIKEDVLKHLPETSPVHQTVAQLLSSPSFSDPAPLLKQFMAWGGVALAGLAGFLAVLVIAIYFVADGPRVYEWLLAFLPEHQRKKVDAAALEIGPVVGSYMAGQLITSLLCGAYVFILLSVLHVPNATLLAVLAGLFDVLPLIGFFLAVIPALASALTVSPTAAILVGVLYAAYHLVETYIIVPKVYGDRLRLSTLTVLISCMAAGVVGGVIGAIAILPIIASYPIVERVWLRPFLEGDTVAKHREIDEREHPGN